jgi:hypothetical protein
VKRIMWTMNACVRTYIHTHIRGCIQKFPDWLPGARTANGTALCHRVQLYRYFMSQSSEFCRHNPLCCFSTSVYCCKHIFSYRLSSETFGYILVRPSIHTYTHTHTHTHTCIFTVIRHLVPRDILNSVLMGCHPDKDEKRSFNVCS